MPEMDPLTLGLLIVAALALGVAAVAVALALHLRTRVYALEQLQGLTTRRIRVIADAVDVPLAVERRRGARRPSGMEDRRRPLTDGPVPEGRPRSQQTYYDKLGATPREPSSQFASPPPPPPPAPPLPPLRREVSTDEIPRG